jgi:hypothetical protein
VPDEGLVEAGRRQRLEPTGVDEPAEHGEGQSPDPDRFEELLPLAPLLLAGGVAGEQAHPGGRQHGEGKMDHGGVDR